jgi:hypothetical protein
MGSGMGGLISLYAVCEYLQVFGGRGWVSTHWLVGENLLVDYFGAVLPGPIVQRLHFDYGTAAAGATWEAFQLRTDELLSARGYQRE